MYVVRAALSSIARNKLMAFVSLGVIVVSIFVFGIFLTVTANVQGLLSGMKEKVEIKAFLYDGLSDEEVSGAKEKILALQGVHDLIYISKDEALKTFREELSDRPDLLEAIETNPLPASFNIRLVPEYRTEEEASSIAAAVEAMDQVEEAEYGKEWVGRLDEIVRILLILDVAIGGVIAVSCLFLVFNTIRLTVFARREEIEIMSLVGATDGFIRRPFLLVGLLYGIIGGGVASGLLYGSLWAVALKIPAIRLPLPSYIAGLMLFAALLGYFGSLFSVRRFLST